ncbi:hypothetical protein HYN43_016115 [Mucilaginibacter celer]|uniref:Uncharacterized protein n=1 Tax=Mucilaginibacter celer TaxID=2305508 RepID=A0A494W0E9_9SPHI|nr:hypothetical protein HYN43_016115 [Mucilaginibacter celer]
MSSQLKKVDLICKPEPGVKVKKKLHEWGELIKTGQKQVYYIYKNKILNRYCNNPNTIIFTSPYPHLLSLTLFNII